MFKKLQNLLFEDEDEDIVNDEATSASQHTQQMPVQPSQPVVQPQAVVTPAPAPVAPVQPAAPAAPVQPAPVQPVQAASAVKAEPAPVQPAVKEEKKPTLGFTVDEISVEKKKPAKPAPVKAAPVKKEPVEDNTNYQFRPVISPIFGVDEKDVNALKNTTSKISKAKAKKKEENVTPVLSPMYGVAVEEPAAVKEEEDDATDLLSQINANAATVKDDDIPEFSLDDILKVRDEEIAEDDRAVKTEEAPMFPDLTFEDEDAPEEINDSDDIPSDLPVDMPASMPANMPADPVDENIDNTVVIKQQLFDDDEN